ncbi:MAG: ATP-binding protein, partial [Bradyrhizobium sp.]|nr:ATP-binding protein [Bradyrhizobium sp.]
STEPQSTSSVPAVYDAMAYAPDASAPVDSSPAQSAHTAPASRYIVAENDLTTTVAKGRSVVATSTRTAPETDDAWTRMMMLAPSARTSMSVTMLGDPNMTLLSKLFVKPQAVIVMGFSDDPQAGLTTDHFSGPAIAPLTTQAFMRTASLH